VLPLWNLDVRLGTTMDSLDLPDNSPKRKRLQQWFAQGNAQMAQGNHDYAHEMFTQCVLGAPDNLIYVQSFLGNLKRKYNNNKKGGKLAKLKGAGTRGMIKKASLQKDWAAVIKSGVEVLKHNPWDVSTLTAMANASGHLDYDEVELAYLKTALDADPHDPDVNRLCALALTEREEYDQAIACWHRFEKVRPGNEEAAKAVADLSVLRTIKKGGYEEKSPGKKTGAADEERHSPRKDGSPAPDAISPEESLQRDLRRNPGDVAKHVELAQLVRASELSGQDDDILDRLSDVQIRRLRDDVAKLQEQLAGSPDEEIRQQLEEMERQLAEKEIEVRERRCDRFPTNLTYRYDLGICYRDNGKYAEAIAEFQKARADTKRLGVCLLSLGQCFQQIKQYRLAMSHYEDALREISDRDAKNKKRALHLAAKLAFAMKNYDVAENHATALAALDFSYKDVSTLLDKIAKIREDDGESA
jgi:tetratricopeptide (TPR) repeat protein